MASEFKRCTKCSIIFPSEDGKHELCPKCRGEATDTMSSADTLRMLKNAIRDVMSSGEMITVTQLSEKTGIDESRIWHHIHSGEISTASFSDPQVQDYMHKKKVERIQMKRKMSGKHEEPAKEAPKEKKPKSGFHISSDDES